MIELPILDDAGPEAEQSEPPSKQRFWRSMADYKKNPTFQKLAQQEFHPDATEKPSGASRRQFLQLMGASMAMAGLTACRRPVEKILPYTRKPEEVIPGVPLYYATAMPFRGSVRPLLVESHEGRPTKVEANPDHPSNSNGTGLFEQASVLTLYDPDRSRKVLRDGDSSSWQAFVDFCQTFGDGAPSKRVAVLSAPTSSPTLLAMREQLEQQFPQTQWITYRSEGDDPEALGMQQAFGRPLRPHYDFSDAAVVVSLDADFMGPTATNGAHNQRTFAQSRRLAAPEDGMSRFYAVESAYTVTGGLADHRLRLKASDIPHFAAALAAQMGLGGSGSSRFQGHPYVHAIADDLEQAGSDGVILAGDTQPPAIHALCAAINDRLGSSAVTYLDTGQEVTTSQSDALETLVGDMEGGQVDALIMLGVNPVYDAPADLNFEAALKRVNETIHVGLHVDETARASRWHLPRTHYLEAWGDGRTYDGTLSIVQPLIAPLYEEAHSDLEILSALLTGLDQSGYDLVREQWRGVIPNDFETTWRRTLHDGFLPDTQHPTVQPAASMPDLSGLPAPNEDALEVVFALDPSVLDGSFANNAWCQELPDPITKIVWDNAVIMSPATAERLGLQTRYSKGNYYSDIVEVRVNGQSVQLPIWEVPGHADNSILVHLGYGRDITSRRPERTAPFFDTDNFTDIYGDGALATGVGKNVAPLRTAAFGPVALNAELAATGESYQVVTTQDHGAINPGDRPLIRMTTLDEYQAQPSYFKDQGEPSPGEPFEQYPMMWELDETGRDHPKDDPSYKDNPYYENQWGMTIDLNACNGCNACIVACNSENNIQVVGKDEVSRGREMHWLRLDRYFVSPSTEDRDIPSDPQMVLQPMMCQHCENAPCESVCPVAATVHSPDGMNQMIYNRCIGTRYCSNNCPYKVRRYNWYNWTKTLPVEVQMAQNPNVTMRFRGVMEKCSWCIQRIRASQQRANVEQRSLEDGDVLTACQQACPADAIVFGDLNDPTSEVNKQREDPRRYEMLAYLNVKPRLSYLGRVRNANPALDETVA